MPLHDCGLQWNNYHTLRKQNVAVSGRIFEKAAKEIELHDFAGFVGLRWIFFSEKLVYDSHFGNNGLRQ